MPVNRINGYKLEYVDLTATATVSPAGVSSIPFKPPKGVVWEIVNIYCLIPDPAGSGAGDHRLEIITDNFANTLSSFATLISDFGTTLQISRSAFAATTEIPSTSAEQYNVQRGGIIKSSFDQPVSFKYTNGTDVNQSGSRVLEILYRIVPEAI